MAPHTHRTHASGQTRAGVLGANDGILSIAGLMLGAAALHTDRAALLLIGLSGLVAGALSMGAGEYVSVSSQADIEHADLELERQSLESDYSTESDELRDIYIRRGLDRELATRVAQQLMLHDALGAHARDEIGITDALSARPLQAATASSISFALGGLIPCVAAWLVPAGRNEPLIAIIAISLVALAILGAIAARAGGAPLLRGSRRVLVWGAATLAVSAAIGSLMGTSLH